MRAERTDDEFLDPFTFPEQINDIFGIKPEYNYAYTGETKGGQRVFTLNKKSTQYKPLKIVCHNMRVISKGIERKVNPKTKQIMDGYQMSLSFGDDYADSTKPDHDAYAIFKAIDQWMLQEIQDNCHVWNEEDCPSLDVAALKYTKCLSVDAKKMVSKSSGQDIPVEEVKKWDPKDKVLKYAPVLNVDVKQEVMRPKKGEKGPLTKLDRFKTDFVTASGDVLDVNVHNYGGLFDKGTVLNCVIQLDNLSSTIGSTGRNRINLSIVQAEEVTPPKRSADSQENSKRQLFDMTRKRLSADNDVAATKVARTE